MDTFIRGTAEYEEAHGLYLRSPDVLRLEGIKIVSPGESPPGKAWTRAATLAHPGVAREMAETPAGRQALLDSISYKHYGLTGQGQGCDIAEFQSSTPSGFQFYIPRLLNENNREDRACRMHKRNIDAWGAPSGAYGIVRPGGDAVAWANHFADLLHELGPWAFVPTVDVELGDPAGNRPYVATVVQVLRDRGFPTVMGYFSAGSAYRFSTQDLVDLWWLAAWGASFPAGAVLHQYVGSPLDRDYCPDYARISGGPAPEVDPLAPFTGADLVGIFEIAQVHLLQTNNDYVNTLLSIAAHAPQFLNDQGYELSRETIQYIANTTPVNADGTGGTVGEALAKLIGVPHTPLVAPQGKPELVTVQSIREGDAAMHEGLARLSARLAS